MKWSLAQIFDILLAPKVVRMSARTGALRESCKALQQSRACGADFLPSLFKNHLGKSSEQKDVWKLIRFLRFLLSKIFS
jgi:hypothetical protein